LFNLPTARIEGKSLIIPPGLVLADFTFDLPGAGEDEFVFVINRLLSIFSGADVVCGAFVLTKIRYLENCKLFGWCRANLVHAVFR
jgi:hypothetical protein